MSRRVAAAAVLALAALASSAVAQGRVVVDTLHSRALRGNLVHDAPDREVLVYLPPGYDAAPARRFPVVYLLHGATSTAREWLDGSYAGFDLRAMMDSLVGAGATPFLVVMLDADNEAGAVAYVDSPASGQWETLVTKELVAFVDRRYRTIARADRRGLAGHSLGGLAVLHLAPRHPDVFGHVYAMSPCCLGFVAEMAPTGSAWATGAVRQQRMGAAFAPAPDRPPHFGRLPFAPRADGGVDSFPEVLSRWRSGLPLERVALDVPGLRRLQSLGLETGTRESPAFSVLPGTRAYARALDSLHVPHDYAEFDGGHIDRTAARFGGTVLPRFAALFAGQARVDGHVVHSDSLPSLEVRVHEGLAYLGRLAYPVDTVAEAEAYVFADTAQGRVRRALIVHFEHFLPRTGRTFRYPALRTTTLGGVPWLHQTWAFAQLGLWREPAIAEFLRQRGLTVEPRWVMDRYVRTVPGRPDHEVILFYVESGAVSDPSITWGGAPVAPPPPPTPPAAAEAAIHARARAAFTVRSR